MNSIPVYHYDSAPKIQTGFAYPFSTTFGKLSSRIIGVYVIRNHVNKKVYVGASRNVGGRWNSHRIALRSRSHDNERILQDWDIHTEAAFVFELLEVTDRLSVWEKERFWIDKLQSEDPGKGYNKKPRIRPQHNRPKSRTIYTPTISETDLISTAQVYERLGVGKERFRRYTELDCIKKTCGAHRKPGKGNVVWWPPSGIALLAQIVAEDRVGLINPGNIEIQLKRLQTLASLPASLLATDSHDEQGDSTQVDYTAVFTRIACALERIASTMEK